MLIAIQFGKYQLFYATMKILLSFICLFAACNVTLAQVAVKDLRTENSVNPIGIDTRIPRFSWQLESQNNKPVFQQAYEIEVDSTDNEEEKVLKIWSSGKVLSDRSLYVPYNSAQVLRSGRKYFWKVRVWDNLGKVSAWSGLSFWTMGLLSPSDWQAKWIGPGLKNVVKDAPPLLRTSFLLVKTVSKATAYITSHGFYEAKINGKKIGDSYLSPGWTSYNKRLQYQAYDVTDLLSNGENTIGVILGSGWYRSPLGPYTPRPDFYGKELGLLLQIKVIYSDGSEKLIVSDENWKSSTGELRFAEIYDGCILDSRLEQTGWLTNGFNDKNWQPVSVQSHPKNKLVATYNEPIKKHETFRPVKVITTPKGEKVIDFGQNLVGWVLVSVSGRAGDSIKISHAEVLDKAGNFYTENLRVAKAQNIYVLKDAIKHTYEPQFTWQGFRYIKVEGIKGELNPVDFTAVAIYSDMQATGSFACSNPMLNQLQHNIQWGQKGNFLDVPTDCPQRDERLGWTGDAQVFARTASFNMDVHNFFTKWLEDVAADQYPSGSIPYIIPDVFTNGKDEVGGSSGWGDVATIVPWNMYIAYGDKQILENQFSSMKAWVKFIEKQTKNGLWVRGNHFGDWLFYSMNDDKDGRSAITNKYLIAQCFYAYSTQILINTAKVLNKKADEQYYTQLLQTIKNSFAKEYVTPNGLISSDTQTAYVLALEFDMLPVNLRQQAAARLVKNISLYNNHLTTGFLGTPYLCSVLSRFGYEDIAYKLLLQDTYPSWLYPIKAGATTIWERWDGIKTDGSFEDPSMNSYNHYAYGAIGDWMYQNIAGIQAAAPGYKKIIIKPIIGGGLTWAEGKYACPYGQISCRWEVTGSKLNMKVTIPKNTTAEIFVPNVKGDNFKKFTVNGGDYQFAN
jgi:alpha-L-rhamnosidase